MNWVHEGLLVMHACNVMFLSSSHQQLCPANKNQVFEHTIRTLYINIVEHTSVLEVIKYTMR